MNYYIDGVKYGFDDKLSMADEVGKNNEAQLAEHSGMQKPYLKNAA